MDEDILTKINTFLMKYEIKDHNYYLVDYNIPNSTPQDYDLPQYLKDNIDNSTIFNTNLDSNFFISIPNTYSITDLKDKITEFKSDIILLVIDIQNGLLEYSNVTPKSTELLLSILKLRKKP